MERRIFLASSIGGMASLSAFSVLAQDQLPDTPLNMYVGFPAGTATDALARNISDRVRNELGRPVVVMNQAGATGMISLERLKRAPADGSVVGLVPLTSALVAPMFKSKVDFNFTADFEPVIMIGQYALVFSVSSKVPAEDWRGFLQWAKGAPNELFYGHGGTGSLPHLVGTLVSSATGLKMQDVPFKGDVEVLGAMVGGQVQTGLIATITARPHYQAKRLKVIAVTSRARDPSMPDVPTFTELGYPAAVSENWVAVFAPKGTPARALAIWNRAIHNALSEPGFRQSLVNSGYVVVGGSSEALRDTVVADAAKWRRVMDSAGFKPTD